MCCFCTYMNVKQENCIYFLVLWVQSYFSIVPTGLVVCDGDVLEMSFSFTNFETVKKVWAYKTNQ